LLIALSASGIDFLPIFPLVTAAQPQISSPLPVIIICVLIGVSIVATLATVLWLLAVIFRVPLRLLRVGRNASQVRPALVWSSAITNTVLSMAGGYITHPGIGLTAAWVFLFGSYIRRNVPQVPSCFLYVCLIL